MTIGTLEMRKGQLNENLVLNLLNWERKCKVLGEKVPSVCRSLGFGVFLFIYLFYFLYLHSVFNYFWLCFEACRVLVPQPGIKPVLPAMEAVLTTGPLGKSVFFFLIKKFYTVFKGYFLFTVITDY